MSEKKKEACIGCRHNRYNQPEGCQEEPNDAPVNGKGCFLLYKIRYNRKKKEYECPHNSYGLERGG